MPDRLKQIVEAVKGLESRVLVIEHIVKPEPVAPERKAGDRCELPINVQDAERAKGLRFEYTHKWGFVDKDAKTWFEYGGEICYGCSSAEKVHILRAIPIETVSLICISSDGEVFEDEMVIDQGQTPDWAQIEREMVARNDAAVIVKDRHADHLHNPYNCSTVLQNNQLGLPGWVGTMTGNLKLSRGLFVPADQIPQHISRIQQAIRERNAPKWEPQPGKLAFNTSWDKIVLITEAHDGGASGKVIGGAGEVFSPYEYFRPLTEADWVREIPFEGKTVKVRAFYAENGYLCIERFERDEWLCFVACNPDNSKDMLFGLAICDKFAIPIMPEGWEEGA